MSRNKEVTKQRLLDAAGRILATQGFAGIGVNALAREAGVDKVLIYRYFGDLDGLLRTFIAQKDYFSKLGQFPPGIRSMREKSDIFENGKQLLIGLLRELLQSKELQEILLWELHTKNALTDEVAENRERKAGAIIEEMRQVLDFDDVDLPAITSILAGGISYLALRSRQIETTYNGIDLNSEEGWQRIEEAIITILDRTTGTGFKNTHHSG